MKLLLLAMLAAVIFTGCATTSETEESFSRSRVGNNVGDIGRQSSPSAPFTRGNGSQSF
jgi:hypothetical protein